MGLQEEIDRRSKDIHTDTYPISIGEVLSMYKEGDINIHPEFQRFFRWEEIQKSKLIESILLGFPIPPIFVAMRPDGIWDVVDGVQRLSTIFQFAGILKDERNELLPPLKLLGTRYLPSMNAKIFDGEDETNSFSEVQRRYFKRAKLSFIQVLKESDPSSKYELFQRLNTGGTLANSQEVRNCILVMENIDAYNRIVELSKNTNFQESIRLTERLLEEKYDLELLVRFIVLRKLPLDSIKQISDLSEFLNEEIVRISNDSDFSWEQEQLEFNLTFEILNSSVGADCFRKYHGATDRFSGGFIVSAFEIVAFGVGFNASEFQAKGRSVKDSIVSSYSIIENEHINWAGQNTTFRLPKTIEVGRRVFQNG
jgi:hypothetical protein